MLREMRLAVISFFLCWPCFAETQAEIREKEKNSVIMFFDNTGKGIGFQQNLNKDFFAGIYYSQTDHEYGMGKLSALAGGYRAVYQAKKGSVNAGWHILGSPFYLGIGLGVENNFQQGWFGYFNNEIVSGPGVWRGMNKYREYRLWIDNSTFRNLDFGLRWVFPAGIIAGLQCGQMHFFNRTMNAKIDMLAYEGRNANGLDLLNEIRESKLQYQGRTGLSEVNWMFYVGYAF